MKLNYRYIPSKDVLSPPIVFLHGLFGDLSNFNTLSRKLNEKNYNILQIDLRNHGRSFHHILMNYPIMAKDVYALLDFLSINQYIVVGHSMGGKVAMTLPLLSKKRIIKMIIIDIAPTNYTMKKNHIFAAINHVNVLCIKKRSQAFDVMSKFITNSNIIFFLLKSFKQGKWNFNIQNIQNNYLTLNQWKYYEPWMGDVLFISGGQSNYIQKHHYDNIYQQFPKSQIYKIDDSGHWLHSEKIDDTLNIINYFLK